ncbi:hypothetical protein VaNZ11_000470 [Volvox africanus]|uniref:Uncharacterized protein n=1 Tax=Volvox africanus TaxID=51714 RepID=A0ABQ5RNV6_9CHLO|nr:hypothetical protein VaNZ11_000470 [Volvox africanus]
MRAAAFALGRVWRQPGLHIAIPTITEDFAINQSGGAYLLHQLYKGDRFRGLATGNHPLYEIEKIRRTSEGHIDITEDEPGTGDMPHMTGTMPELVEEEFRAPEAERVGAGLSTNLPTGLPEFFSGDFMPASDASDASDASAASADPHGGPHQGSSHGGPSLDYSHGEIPVVTDPVTGLASGTVLVADEEARRELGQAVIRRPGEEKLGVNSKQGPELEGH